MLHHDLAYAHTTEDEAPKVWLAHAHAFVTQAATLGWKGKHRYVDMLLKIALFELQIGLPKAQAFLTQALPLLRPELVRTKLLVERIVALPPTVHGLITAFSNVFDGEASDEDALATLFQEFYPLPAEEPGAIRGFVNAMVQTVRGIAVHDEHDE